MDDNKQQVENAGQNQHEEIIMPDLPADVAPKGKFVFKFYCNGCSGRAFLSEEKEKFDSRTCQTCGTTVHYNEGNYLPLSESEKQTFNG